MSKLKFKIISGIRLCNRISTPHFLQLVTQEVKVEGGVELFRTYLLLHFSSFSISFLKLISIHGGILEKQP